eukprot:6482037-Amphidinium_carterae.1
MHLKRLELIGPVLTSSSGILGTCRPWIRSWVGAHLASHDRQTARVPTLEIWTLGQEVALSTCSPSG